MTTSNTTSTTTTPTAQHHDLSPVIDKLFALLQEHPVDLEITILPTTTTTTTTTDSLEASLVLQQGHLGIEARSLPWMTRDIRNCYQRLRKQRKSHDHDDDHDMMYKVTSCLLLVNPDHSTAWADRRRSLHQRLVDTPTMDAFSCWKEELSFLNLLTTQHSKAPSSWGHRKYVLQQVLQQACHPITNNDDDLVVQNVLQEEIQLCRRVAEQYPKNYYAWTHRRYLWTLLLLLLQQQHYRYHDYDFYQDEWKDIITQWLPHHVSDHSAVHYGVQVLQLYLKTTTTTDSSSIDQQEDWIVHHVWNPVVALTTPSSNNDNDTIIQQQQQQHEPHEALWILRRLVAKVLLDWSLKKTNLSNSSRIQTLIQKDVQKHLTMTLLPTITTTTVVEKEKEQDNMTKQHLSYYHYYGWTYAIWMAWQYQDIVFNNSVHDDNVVTRIVEQLQQQQQRPGTVVHHDMWTEYGSTIIASLRKTCGGGGNYKQTHANEKR